MPASGLAQLAPFLPDLDPEKDPLVDARLEDGCWVAICVPPAIPAFAITIRRFAKRSFSAADLVKMGSLPKEVLNEAREVLRNRHNILGSGGSGSGRTTLLNALSELCPDDDRIDSLNCVRFEARALSGEQGVTIRDLVKHSLRHRPDHIVVGEVRGAEAVDLLQALNTGNRYVEDAIRVSNYSAEERRWACMPVLFEIPRLAGIG